MSRCFFSSETRCIYVILCFVSICILANAQKFYFSFCTGLLCGFRLSVIFNIYLVIIVFIYIRYASLSRATFIYVIYIFDLWVSFERQAYKNVIFLISVVLLKSCYTTRVCFCKAGVYLSLCIVFPRILRPVVSRNSIHFPLQLSRSFSSKIGK